MYFSEQLSIKNNQRNEKHSRKSKHARKTFDRETYSNVTSRDARYIDATRRNSIFNIYLSICSFAVSRRNYINRRKHELVFQRLTRH
jgi:hypothetical protein